MCVGHDKGRPEWTCCSARVLMCSQLTLLVQSSFRDLSGDNTKLKMDKASFTKLHEADQVRMGRNWIRGMSMDTYTSSSQLLFMKE